MTAGALTAFLLHNKRDEITTLFADIRGSTGLAEHMRPAAFRALIDRFYAVATDVLARSEALIDKLAGDQVSGYFIPGFVGPEYPRVAVQAAQELLGVTGHSDPGGPWIPVGIGVHTGDAFVGSVGSPNGTVDVTGIDVIARKLDGTYIGRVARESYRVSTGVTMRWSGRLRYKKSLPSQFKIVVSAVDRAGNTAVTQEVTVRYR